MANPEHIEILKQGYEVWNQWRKDKFDIEPDLRNADLIGADLRSMNFVGANLRNADLSGADLSDAYLNSAKLSGTKLSGANLSNVDLYDTKLRDADLSDAALYSAKLNGTKLSGANLSNVDLYDTKLNDVDLSGANLQNAICGDTIFACLDLSTTKGLDTVRHSGPSTLGMDTYFRSKGKIPEIFLRGCGVPETLITFLPSMLEEAIQFYSCFISYSHEDKEFAKRLHDRLQGEGIRCWLDEHQFKPGDELHKTIYEGIRVYDKVILCCSESSLKSWWVEKEFKNAISKEEDFIETVLIPLSVDGYIYKQSADSWTVGEIKRRFVQDFSNWKDHDAFETAFKKVVAALRTGGGKPPPPPSKLTRRK